MRSLMKLFLSLLCAHGVDQWSKEPEEEKPDSANSYNFCHFFSLLLSHGSIVLLETSCDQDILGECVDNVLVIGNF